MWYIKYFWVKMNIFVLTPLVWIESKIEDYRQFKLEMYCRALSRLT